MDLSGLKWPLIIVVIVAIAWLLSSGGTSFMVSKFTAATPGEDANRDKIDEVGLSRVGGYLLKMWRYDKAAAVFQMAIDRYGPQGPNYWYNIYRQAKCYEKMEQWQTSYNVLMSLIAANAHQYDDRVPINENLQLRAAKLKEVHQLQ